MKAYKHHMVWDLYSEKMNRLIKEHKHAKEVHGKEFKNEKLGCQFKIAFNYDKDAEMFTEMSYQVKGSKFYDCSFRRVSRAHHRCEGSEGSTFKG